MNARLEATAPEALALTADQSLGHIAVQLPGATAIFRRLKLDFCCGGQVSLQQAAQDKGLDVQTLLTELRALQRPQDMPVLSDPAALIDHIISRFHDVHRAQLPELIRMARRVEAVHRDNVDVPVGLAELLESMAQELVAHMGKEEAILFPAMRLGGNPWVSQPMAMMRAEHLDHGAQLDRLLQLTHDAAPPAGACNTWRALYAGIAQLRDDLINHIHLENNVLFAHFDALNAPTTGCGASACGCG